MNFQYQKRRELIADMRSTTGVCPFHDGPQTVDLLLAELSSEDGRGIDLALDLRSSMSFGRDADCCLSLFFALRAELGERHYLALYRIRCWMRRCLSIQVRRDRASEWRTVEFPLGYARMDELINGLTAALLEDGLEWPLAPQFRFAFMVVQTADYRLSLEGCVD